MKMRLEFAVVLICAVSVVACGGKKGEKAEGEKSKAAPSAPTAKTNPATEALASFRKYITTTYPGTKYTSKVGNVIECKYDEIKLDGADGLVVGKAINRMSDYHTTFNFTLRYEKAGAGWTCVKEKSKSVATTTDADGSNPSDENVPVPCRGIGTFCKGKE